MSARFRIANAVLLVLFVSWAGFQYSDPDALLWIAVYSAAAIECALFLLGRLPGVLAVAYMALCVPWALYLGARVVLGSEFIFDEQGREVLGLLICASWTYVLYHHGRGRRATETVSTFRQEA